MRNKPRIRFKGFTEDWEQCKLGSLATVEMNKRIFKEQTTTKGDIPFYKIGTFGSDADSFISRDLFEEYKNKYPYPNIGDILISASGSIGRTVVYNGEDAYYQDSNIVWLNHNGKIDNSFLLQFYNQVKWAGLEGSTIKRLYNKNILETYIAVPKIEEQRLIGEFFKLVDSSITLHQRKLEKLKLAKKALLQKLFPKNGSQFPEIRFKSFTDAWEQRKFGEIYERAGQKNDLTYDIDKIISVANMYFKKDVTVGSEEYLKTYNVFKLGDIAFEGHTNKEYRYGRFVENTIGDGIVSHIFDVFTPKINLDINFWKDLIKYEPIMGPILRRCTKASRMMSNLTAKEFLEEQILCPTLEEQKLIGEFIVSLDKNITLHQCKLDKLQDVKKGLLQKMFV